MRILLTILALILLLSGPEDDCETVAINAGPQVHYFGPNVSRFLIEPK